MCRPVGVGDVEAIDVLELGEEGPLFVALAHHDQPVDCSLFFRTDKMEAFPDFLVSPATAEPFPVPDPLDYLEDSLRLPAGDDKPDSLLVAVAHEPVVVTGGIRAQQDLDPGKMLPQIRMDFPDQTQVVRLRRCIPRTKHRKSRQAHPTAPQHPQKRVEPPEALIGSLGNPDPALHQSGVDIQHDPPHFLDPKRPYGKPHSALGQPMNVPPSEPPGQVRQRVRPGNSLHPQKSQQPRIGPQKIDIRQPVATFDDHLEKRKNLGRDRIAALPELEMEETSSCLQHDIFGEGHEQSQAAGSGDFGAMKGTEFEILDVLTYHEDTFVGFHLWGEISEYFLAASILPAFWGNRGFFYAEKN